MVKIHIQLNIDTENISDFDKTLLRTLAGDAVFSTIEGLVEAAQSPAPALSVVPDAPEDEAPVAEAEKPKRTRRTKAQIAADEAAAERSNGPDPATEGDEPSAESEGAPDGATLEDAVAAASALLSTGRGPEVKAVLDELGAARVSELKASQYADFIAALPA